MTVVEDISWSPLLKHNTLTAQHGNDGNRIATATETLKQTAHQFVQVLNERATLLANCAQFDTALHDAAAIQAILPGSGLGYLCMGDVYCQQGHHAAAISIYDQGLQAVTESDAYYQQLQQHRMTAIANNNKRVDFISQLPLDIVIINILPRVYRSMFGPLREILYVSRSWQERILKQTMGLKFSFGDETNTFKKGHAQLIRFAPYVQTLSGSLSNVVCLDDLFSRAHFSNLKELSLFCTPPMPLLPLIHGLQLIADSLTHLLIYDCPFLQLCDILETCPNLVSLRTMNVDAIMPLLSSSSYPKMTHLTLHGQSERARTHENIVNVLRTLPSLRVLEIFPIPDSSLLPLLHKHCPYLQVILYGFLRRFSLDLPEKVQANRKGIASAYLHGRDFYKQDDLVQFLHVQRDSLETLKFRGDIEIDDDDAFWTISNGHVQSSNQHPENNPSFPRLVDLGFTNIHPSTTGVPMVLWILLNAPNLTTIHIHDIYFRPAIVNAMIKLRHLQKIQIDVVSKEDDNGIRTFLKHHIALGDHSTLEHVVVDSNPVEMSKKPWIALLSRLTRLKNLELLAGVISDNCIPIMAAIGQGCPTLEKLTLGMYGAELADGLLMPLRKHSNLEYLKIGADESLSDNDLLALCTFLGLKQLQLRFIVSDDLLEMLEDRIPHVEIGLL